MSQSKRLIPPKSQMGQCRAIGGAVHAVIPPLLRPRCFYEGWDMICAAGTVFVFAMWDFNLVLPTSRDSTVYFRKNFCRALYFACDLGAVFQCQPHKTKRLIYCVTSSRSPMDALTVSFMHQKCTMRLGQVERQWYIQLCHSYITYYSWKH